MHMLHITEERRRCEDGARRKGGRGRERAERLREKKKTERERERENEGTKTQYFLKTHCHGYI